MNVPALGVAVALLALNGFFVAAEFALIAARRSRIEQLAADGNKRAVSALAGIRELSLMLAGAQLGITMASFGLGAVAEPALEQGFSALLGGLALPSGVSHAISLTLALGITVFLHMVVGEMAPKSWAISHPEQSALALARPFRAFARAFRPVIYGLNSVSNMLVRACGVEPQDELAMAHSPADLALLLATSAQEGTLAHEEHQLLARALDLSGLDAESAMVPRGDVVAVPADATVAEIEAVASTTGRSRLPVYEGSLDRIVGVLHVKDVLAVNPDDRATTNAAALARQAFVTPESRPLEDLMRDLRHQRQHVAIVIDEHGGVSGLVSLEDLLEEVIGDFEDESDRAGRRRRAPARADGSLLVDGHLRPDEVAARTGVTLPTGDYETIAGFLIATLGRLPGVGDACEHDGAHFEVTQVDGHRVVEIAVRPPARAGGHQAR